MHKAAQEGRMDFIRSHLYEKRTYPNDCLMAAAGGGHLEVLKLLLSAMTGFINYKGILAAAAANGQNHVVRFCLTLSDDEVGWALDQAADHGHYDTTKLLLETRRYESKRQLLSVTIVRERQLTENWRSIIELLKSYL